MISVGEGNNINSSPPCSKVRVLFNFNFRLEAFEHFLKTLPFSDVTCSRRSSCYHEGRLVYEHRFERCLFSHYDCFPSSKVSSFQFKEPSLPVQSSPFRIFSGPSCVHKVHDCSFISSMVQRDTNPALFGRLDAVCPLKIASCPWHHSALGARAEAGSFCKQGKELPGSNANNHLHWNASGLSFNVCHPITSPSGQRSSAHCSYPAGSEFAIQSVTTTSGDVRLGCSNFEGHFCDTTVVAPPQATLVVEQQFAVEPRQISSQLDSCLTSLYSGILMSGVPLGVIFPFAEKWSRSILLSLAGEQRGITGVSAANGVRFDPEITSISWSYVQSSLPCSVFYLFWLGAMCSSDQTTPQQCFI